MDWGSRARRRFRLSDVAPVEPPVSVLYAFVCPSCNQTLEEFFPLGQSPETVTCDCGAPARKSISRVAFLRVPGGHNDTYTKS